MSLEDKKQDLPGTIDDLRNLKKFWDHFKVPLPEGAYPWIEAKLGEEDPELTYDEKLKVQFYIAYGHCADNVEVFKDAIFEKANANSEKIVFERQFEIDLDKTLREPDPENEDTDG